MSGGSLNYFYSQLEDHVGDFEDKELDELVKDLAELFHDREWYLSADTGIGSWREARDAFKDKWFSEHGRQERIERYLEEISDDVREMFGISNKRCEKCKHEFEAWGYSDANYYNNVIPNAICPNCGLNSNGETAEQLKARMGRTYVI